MAVINRTNKGFNFGVIFALLACACWAFAFVVPVFLSRYSASDIAISRYLVFGLLSTIYYAFSEKSKSDTNTEMWLIAFIFACSSHTFYFYILVKGMQLVGPEIAIAIIGLMPITVAITGNMVSKEFAVSRLIFPIILSLVGLAFLYYIKVFSNVQDFDAPYKGLLYCIAALALWTFYGVSNTVFLKKNPNMQADVWSSMIGIMCFFQAIIWGLFQILFEQESKISFDNLREMATLILWATGLAIIPSWLATTFWNKSTRLIPAFLAGQLIIFETIIAFFYIFVVLHSFPTIFEIVGLTMMLAGIYLTIRTNKHQYV